MKARLLALLAAAASVAACGHEEKNLSGQSQAQPPASAAPESPANPHAANPHAAGGDPHAGMAMVPKPPASPLVSPVSWTLPEGWKESPPSSSMRLAQFDTGADESGETIRCIVFGGSMGSVDDNLARWIGQMGPGAKDGAVVTKSEKDGVKVTRLAASGSYTDSMRSDPRSYPQASMLAAVVEAPGGMVYVKFAGPKALVDANAAKFDAFLASLKSK